MQFRIPFTKDKPQEKIIVEKTIVEKDAGVLAGFFEANMKLSDEKSVSSKLLEANRDWVYKNNDVIAKEVASIEFELYRVKIVNGEFEYEEIEDHKLLRLLDKFNETTTKYDGIYTTQSHKKLAGDSFWLLDGKNDDIENIFTLEPDKVTLELGDFSKGDKRLVEKYTYKATVDGKEITKSYSPEEIIPFKMPDPSNPYRGKGVVEAAAETIDLDFLTTDLSKKFFKNGAITNFILTTDGKISEANLKRIKAEFKSAYGGVKNAFKTMIFGGGLKPVNIQSTYKEMDFLAQLEWYRDKIMVLFGNTKASLGIIDDVNRASHESSMIAWKRNSVKPDMQAICDTLNEYLVPRYGNDLILTFEDPIPEDRQAKLDEVKMLVEQKLVSRNEARQMLGLGEVDGEEHNVIPINDDKTPPNINNVDTEKIFRKRGLYTKLNDYRRYKEIGKEIAKMQLKKRKENTVIINKIVNKENIHTTLSNEQVLNYVDKQLSAVDRVEERLKNKVEQFILNVKEIALNSYPEKQPKQYSKALFNKDDLLVQAELDFSPLLREVASISGNEALKLIDSKEPYFVFDYEDSIKKNVRKFTGSMLDTETEKMTAIIKDGLEAGDSIAVIRRRMSNEFDNLSKVQSERIARTEVIRTSNEASIDAWKQNGTVEGKQWLSTEDNRTDSECAKLDGKIVWNLSGNFYETKNEFENGDPPIHPNCRCVILPVLDKEKYFDGSTVTRIKELESQVDKRTKEFKKLKKLKLEQDIYIAELEKLAGIKNE